MTTSNLKSDEKNNDNFYRKLSNRLETIAVVGISSFFLFDEFHNEIDLYKHQKWQTISIHESLDTKFDHYQGKDGYTLVLPTGKPQSWIYQSCDAQLSELCQLLKNSKSSEESVPTEDLDNMSVDYYQLTYPTPSEEVILKEIKYVNLDGKEQSINYLNTPPQHIINLKKMYYYLWLSFAVIIINNGYIFKRILSYQNLPKPFIYSTLCILSFYSLYMLYEALNITLY